MINVGLAQARPNYVFCPVPANPNMSPEKLRDLILAENNLVSAGSILLTVPGLPYCEKSPLVAKLLGKQFDLNRSKLMKKVADIKEEGKGFCLFELGAVRDEGSKNWQWYQFSKRSRYLSCFVSALESNENQARGKTFAYQPCKQYMFDNEALDNCFHNVYQLLSAFYNDTSANSSKSIPTDELAGATFTLVNVWDIGFNKAILHFLTLLSGYLHYNFPILTLTYPDDVEHLTDPLNISQNELLEGLQPILCQYSRAEFLLNFSHLARSFKSERKGVCQVVSILDPKKKQEREQHKEIAEDLKKKISKEAKKLGAEDLMCEKPPWIIDPEREEDLDTLKKNLDSLVSSEQQDSIPLSWFFLRNAFFKTGKLYIKTRKLKKHAEKCRITGGNFEEFLSRFTGFGSIIHIPDIPVLRDYVILNPPDFFHKLTELLYPRYNGDLKYGIASLSTLRRLFGEDLQFFRDVLTSCSFAVEIDSNQIVYADEISRLPIAEPCFYVPGMRTEVESQKESEIHKDSLVFVYKKALLPTHITENVVKFLFQSKLGAKLCLVTCDCYTITRFAYYSHLKWLMPIPHAPTPPLVTPDEQVASSCKQWLGPVSIKMISHGDKSEIRIENDVNKATDIKKEIVRAYRKADNVYSDYQQRVLGIKSEFEFALVCQVNPNDEHHAITGDTACPECCKDNESFKSMWDMWRQVLLESRETLTT